MPAPSVQELAMHNQMSAELARDEALAQRLAEDTRLVDETLPPASEDFHPTDEEANAMAQARQATDEALASATREAENMIEQMRREDEAYAAKMQASGPDLIRVEQSYLEQLRIEAKAYRDLRDKHFPQPDAQPVQAVVVCLGTEAFCIKAEHLSSVVQAFSEARICKQVRGRMDAPDPRDRFVFESSPPNFAVHINPLLVEPGE